MLRFLANLFWFFSCLPGYIAFRYALHFPQAAQRAVARRQRSRRGREVILYEPTSGTAGGTKRIPYTRQLQAEFLRAINPWIAHLYLSHPSLFFTRHYWSISPSTQTGTDEGFATDSDYLGIAQRFIAHALFSVPPNIRHATDHARATLLHLLADTHLGLISVWHPSFLLILLETAVARRKELCGALTNRTRAAHLLMLLAQGEAGYAALWPNLRVISCWAEARAAADAEKIKRLFPGVALQPKGLIATEGIVTIPWGTQKVAAIRSHRLHFCPEEGGGLIPPESVIPGQTYTVFLTTGNGFSAYPLNDLVRCTGFIRRTPCFDFLSRTGQVIDLRGEKLHGEHVEAALRQLESESAPFTFAMLTPNETADGYTLHIESDADPVELAARLDALLCANFHYRHARAIGQLKTLTSAPIVNGMQQWRAFREVQGCRQGSVKPTAFFAESFSCKNH